jgi:hypothetical protein
VEGWQVHQASLRQVSWDQARLGSDVLQLDQNASILTAGGFLADASGDLTAMSRELDAGASARTAEQQADARRRSALLERSNAMPKMWRPGGKGPR